MTLRLRQTLQATRDVSTRLLFFVCVLLAAGRLDAAEIINQAGVQFLLGPGVTNRIFSSPVRTISQTAIASQIHFYQNGSFSSTSSVTTIGQPLYVQAGAPGCNVNPFVVETRVIVLRSALTGDAETFAAVESDTNSGLFRILPNVPTRSAQAEAVVAGNGFIETLKDDVVTAEIDGCGGGTSSALILIDPGGVVFESRSNLPVPGARVRLVDANTGLPATVWQFDGVTPAPNTIMTGPDGRYDFPLVAPGVYRLEVVPPPGFAAPSAMPMALLPAGRQVSSPASYGGNFSVNAATGAVSVDTPVDASTAPATGLFVQKTGSRGLAEVGDVIDYTVRVRNVSSNALAEVVVTDALPAGFAYVKGTARYQNAPAPDPAGGAGPALRFRVGPVGRDETVALVYRVRIGVGALQGNGVNSAQAMTEGANPLTSNIAQYQVQLQGGVFTDRGVILGKVFVDANGNRDQDRGEPGVPGVRLYLEDGTYAITDGEGKYSFYGVRPLTHVVKLDPVTLPRGARLVALSTRNAGSPGTRFVDLKKGELHKADFALGTPTKELLQEIERRRKEAARNGTEIGTTIKGQLTPDGVPLVRGDSRGQPASGVIGGPLNGGPSGADSLTARSSVANPRYPQLRPTLATNGIPTPPAPAETNAAANVQNFEPVLPPDTLNGQNSNLPPGPVAALPRLPAEATLTNLNNTLAFLGLKDGDTLPMPQAHVRVKGPLGSKFQLFVNAIQVPASRLGRRAESKVNKLEAWEFIGVAFKAGTNTLEVVQLDGFGNPRERKTIRVIAPDRLAQIKIRLPSREQPADGRTVAKIGVELRDVRGVPVTARTPLTLESTLGEWRVHDLDAAEPGTQVFIEGGRAEYPLLAPLEPGDAKLRVSSGALLGEATLSFLPDLRPLIAAGVIEGRLSLSKLSSKSLVPARSRDGFEEELRSFAVNGNDGRNSAAARVAFFLKGKIKGEYLLTAGYDSEKETRERLFRDIQPDEFYPVYGDASTRGFDAQSSGQLYVRIDKRKCYLLYGDFISQQSTEARNLGNYSRSLTGLREHYEKNSLTFNLWASKDSTRQVIEELPANGTSGPYLFRTANGIVNSEKVEILTRDRDQPSLILKIVEAARFTDYEFEPFTGRILFRAPVPSLDENLNPISIRVTYEVDQGGETFWVYGADGQVKITPRLELGGSAARDENPFEHYGLYSGNATYQLARRTFVIGEYAQSDTDTIGIGNAGRVELRSSTDKTEARIYYGRADNTFSNTASIVAAGRVEAGAKVAHRVSPSTRLVGQGILTESLDATGGSRKGLRADVEKTFKNQTRVEVGGRLSTETAAPASASTVGVTPNEVRSARTKVTTPLPKVKGASVYGEFENDIVETDKRLIAFGGDYQLQAKTRLYARHEIVNSLGGAFELNSVQQQNTTVVGVDTAYMKDGTLFNEYRARDGISGRDAESALGLRNLWNVLPGVKFNTSFERVQPITGGSQNEATAVAGGVEYTRPQNWKASTRLELRTSDPNDSLLHTFGYAHRLTRDWTFLGRTIVYLVDNKAANTGDKQQARVQGGLAWRQTEINRWNGLGKYEYKIENDGSDPAAELKRRVHILTADLNYQPHPDWWISGHYAAKLAYEEQSRLDHVYHAHLISTRVSYDLSKRWDVGVIGSVFFSSDGRAVQYGFGPEIGFVVKRSLRFAIGYNFFGFHDRDLGQDYTNPGVYLALQLKFDETLLGLGKRKEEK